MLSIPHAHSSRGFSGSKTARNKDRDKDRDRDRERDKEREKEKEKEKEKEREREREKELKRERERERERERDRGRERERDRDRERDKLGGFTLGGEKKKLETSPASSPAPSKSDSNANIMNISSNAALSPDASSLPNQNRLNYGKHNTSSSSMSIAPRRAGPLLSISTDASTKTGSGANSYSSGRGMTDSAEAHDVASLMLKLSQSIQDKEDTERQRMSELELMKKKISSNMESSAQYNFENSSANSNNRSGSNSMGVSIL